jgi:hypothetical protein
MQVGDLVKRDDIIALVVEVMHANEIQWIRVLGARDYVSEIGWKVINPAKTKVEQ